MLSSDLKNLLSPVDRDDRDVENDGADSWGFGVSEDVVTVLGQPMVRSWSRGDSKSPTHLSIIDRDGDIVPTCEIRNEALKKREVASSTDDGVCHAILAGQQVPVPMHQPVLGESLVLQSVPSEYSSEPSSSASTDGPVAALRYRNTAMASEVTYTALSTGVVDFGNGAKARHVGLVSFFDGDSTAGDGTYMDTQVFPVYFDKNGVANLSANANRKLAAVLPHGMRSGKLVTLDGATYLELSPEEKGASSEVWKINASGAHKVCGFKLSHKVVRPLSK